MAKTDFTSVDAYIASKPEAVRPILERVRAAIRKALPRAEEIISYQIPAYRLPGGIVIFFAGWKEHYSVYPASDALVAALARELAPHDISKGTIRFPLSARVPVGLIGRIAKLRAQEVARRAEEKAAAKAKKR
jgi:uncharacterized protein YdhG (YjbR/CyaY superfamily)